MKLILPKLEEWQQDVYDAIKPEGGIYVIKSKRQIGKSCLAAVLLIEMAFKKVCISVIVEPTQAQSRRLYKQIVNMMEKSGLIKSANSQLLTIEFTNGSELLFKSAEQKDALRGFTVSGWLIIDEAAFIDDDIFEILFPTTDANNAPILIISTPLFCSGQFYELYTRGINGDSRIMSFNWSLYDTSKYLPKEKLEYYRNTLSPLKFRSEYLGEFIAEGSYLFGDITANMEDWYGEKAVYGGIDWGSGGGDYTVMITMDEQGKVVDIYSMKDTQPVEQIEQLSKYINSIPSLKTIQVEMNSIGKIYYDNLRQKVNKQIRQFTTTNDSKRNIIEQLIEGFQTNNIKIPYDEELQRELQHYSVEKTSKGYTYNGSDSVNDDYVMALALCYDCYKKNIGQFSINSFGFV